jgi:hypothetical protein
MSPDIDQMILSLADTRWLKVAMIMGRVDMALEKQGADILPVAVHARIVAIVKAGLLESKGDVRRPRYSEVRLPAKKKDMVS